MKDICPQCGKEFELSKRQEYKYKKGAIIFCSRQCSGKYYANKQHSEETEEQRIAKNEKISKTLKSKFPEKEEKPKRVVEHIFRNCAYCGKEFELSRHQKARLKENENLSFCCSNLCSNRLKAINNTRKHREGSINSLQIKVCCGYCNKEFELSRNQKRKYVKDNTIKLYCSTACRNRAISKNNILERPTIKCACCGKDFILSDDQLTEYNKGKTEFYCSRSCAGKINFSKVDLEKRADKVRKLFEDEQFVKNRNEKIKQTNLKKYGYENPFQNTKKIQDIWNQKYGVDNPSQVPEIARKKVITAKTATAYDGKVFDSAYEVNVYEFCKRNNIPIECQIPLQFEQDGKSKITYIDFKIDGLLFECKGGHLLHGVYDYAQDVKIETKLQIYRDNNVIVITDINGADVIPKKESAGSNGLKYLNKCPKPLIGVDIDLFRQPKFPFADDRPECFYKVRVDNKPSMLEAWGNELLRWKMIKNRINYVGGFIDSKSILTAMNVTRTCKQPSWFSKTYAKKLMQKYITTDTIIDTFAGWGSRADACKELNKQYIGCDLNKELVEWHKSLSRPITLLDANSFKYNGTNCSVFICPPYTDYETYFAGQDLKTTQCEWLQLVMHNVPNAREYLMVCKVVDKGWEKYIVEEKINKSHFGTNKEYVLLVKNNKIV